MFVAWRDLRFARGRFLLIGSVVALVTILVGFLSGLTGGLAGQNVSGVISIPADRLVLAQGEPQPTFSDSAIPAHQVSTWRRAEGVTSVQPIAISQTRAQVAGTKAAVALYGVDPSYPDGAPGRTGTVTLSQPAAEALKAKTGDRVTIGGHPFTVAGIGGADWYSHTPIITLHMTDWKAVSGPAGSSPTLLAVSGDPDWAAVDSAAGTVSKTPLMSISALPTFRSEIGSLLMMVGLLFAISGLVVGAFFTVWTMQRRADIAVLKALGASTRSLAKDALGQAFVVLLAGTLVGIAVVVVAGLAAGNALPFMLNAFTTVLPAALMVIVGLIGAAFALRSVTSADPLTALGASR